MASVVPQELLRIPPMPENSLPLKFLEFDIRGRLPLILEIMIGVEVETSFN